jgi:tRNA (cmo5U34)-methyltransferase
MSGEHSGDMLWQESDSRAFIDIGRVITPGREEIERTIVGLLPADPDDAFFAVELGCGAGWLSDAALRAFPRARVLALDPSEEMRRAAGELLAPHGSRVELRPFLLDEDAWLHALEAGPAPRCVFSCLVVHHLDGPGKRALYARLHTLLEPGGALLIADLIEPASDRERRFQAERWDAAVRERSQALTGNPRTWEFFDTEHWNLWHYPDPDFDKPSTAAEHLTWLSEAGFAGANIFWAHAGHAVYGGFKP